MTGSHAALLRTKKDVAAAQAEMRGRLEVQYDLAADSHGAGTSAKPPAQPMSGVELHLSRSCATPRSAGPNVAAADDSLDIDVNLPELATPAAPFGGADSSRHEAVIFAYTSRTAGGQGEQLMLRMQADLKRLGIESFSSKHTADV